jgi:hypothetical protein
MKTVLKYYKWQCVCNRFLLVECLPVRVEASALQPPFNPALSSETTKWVRITGVYVFLTSSRWGWFDPWCCFKCVTPEVSQYHLSCFGAIWPKLYWCTVKANKTVCNELKWVFVKIIVSIIITTYIPIYFSCSLYVQWDLSINYLEKEYLHSFW